MDEKDIKLSIIIPTYNNKQSLANTVESLFSQSRNNNIYEIIVVDDGSNDGTGTLFSNKNGISYYRQENMGPAAARNLGIKKSRGAIIAFTDDDCIMDQNWISEIMDTFETDPGLCGVEGRTISDFGLNCFFTHGIFLPSKKDNFSTCNIAYRKKIFEEIGLFDERFDRAWREDTDLAWRILDKGHKIAFNPKVIVFHPAKYIGFFQRFKKSIIYFYEVLLFKKHPARYNRQIHKPILGITSTNKTAYLFIFFLAMLLWLFFVKRSIFLVAFFSYLILRIYKGFNLRHLMRKFKHIKNTDLLLYILFGDLQFLFNLYHTIRGSIKFKKVLI